MKDKVKVFYGWGDKEKEARKIIKELMEKYGEKIAIEDITYDWNMKDTLNIPVINSAQMGMFWNIEGLKNFAEKTAAAP